MYKTLYLASSLSLAALFANLTTVLFAQSDFSSYSGASQFELDAGDEAAESDEEEKINYGPCPCVPRKTLLQWSYGTSFSGGPNLDDPLVSDRPDFTEASSTVGRGVRQLEFGYTYEFNRTAAGPEHAHSAPEALLRWGVLYDWLELRAAWNYAESVTSAGGVRNSARGAEDLYLGTKIGLTPQEGIWPESAVILQTFVPTGSAAFQTKSVLPGVNWLYGWDLTENISTAGSTQFNRVLDDITNEPFVEVAQSWTVGYGLTEKLGAYTEFFGLFPAGSDTQGPEYYFDGGLQYFFTNDLAWDIRAGVGLNDRAQDYFIGTGAVVRF